MTRHTAALTAALALACAAPDAAQPRIGNAQLQERPAGELARTVEQLSAAAAPLWIGYAVPAQNPDWNACCDEWRSHGASCCGRCSLEERGGPATTDAPERPVQLEGGGEAVVLLRVENGRVGKVRAYSSSCELDAGGLPVYWLTGVQMPASIALLTTLAQRGAAEGERKNALLDGALLAIAAHRHAAADQALERLMQPGQPTRTRRQAAFWAAHARGRVGFESVRRAVLNDKEDAEFRKHAVFALSQSREPESTEILVQLAKSDPNPRIRGEAIFWLAQRAGSKAAGAITDAIENDPDTKVKERAVFALSQLPKDDGIPKLIEVARTNRNPRVRKQAIFWLGQSKDQRAIKFFEEILAKE